MQRHDMEERIFGMMMGFAVGTLIGYLLRDRHISATEPHRTTSLGSSMHQD